VQERGSAVVFEEELFQVCLIRKHIT
jgi:hypothetical protein